MQENTKQLAFFKDISGKKIEVDFNGGEVSSDAGLLFLREVESRLGVIAIVLDIDDTDDPTHGSQQLALFNAYHDNYCYMPLHIYEGESGKLITTILRPGKRPSGKEIVMILKRLVKAIRSAWPDVGIILRGDSHYSCPEVFDFCKEHNIKYLLGLTSNNPMSQRAQNLLDQAKELYLLKNEPVRLFGEFMYQAKTWSCPQRVIYKTEYNEKGSNIRFTVTNLENQNRRMIYQMIYCGRGSMELMIKEHKNHLRSDRTSCNRFEANQFRLFLHSIAYVLLHAFREINLKGTQFAKSQFDTIRLKLLKIGARVRLLGTKIKIHLPTSFPFKEEFFKIWESCCSFGFL